VRDPQIILNWFLKFFRILGIYLGMFGKRTIFIQKKSMSVFAEQHPLGQKCLDKIVINQTKPKHLTQNKTTQVDSKTLVQP